MSSIAQMILSRLEKKCDCSNCNNRPSGYVDYMGHAFYRIESSQNQVDGLLEKVRLLTIDVEEMIKINRKIQQDLKLLKELNNRTEVIK